MGVTDWCSSELMCMRDVKLYSAFRKPSRPEFPPQVEVMDMGDVCPVEVRGETVEYRLSNVQLSLATFDILASIAASLARLDFLKRKSKLPSVQNELGPSSEHDTRRGLYSSRRYNSLCPERVARPPNSVSERFSGQVVNSKPKRRKNQERESPERSEGCDSSKMRFSRSKYAQLEHNVCGDYVPTRSRCRPWSGQWTDGLAIFALLLAASSGAYVLGRQSQSGLRHGLPVPVGDKLQVFAYDSTFAMAPTEYTADAWQRLFPENGGFIHHPDLASNFSGIAVFHQLHCLEALYYLYYDATGEGNGGDGPHHHNHHDNGSGAHRVSPPAHARHCFDYLRQALMCQADTNLEQYNYTVNGVTGWGERQCRDYGAVMRFAEQWGGNKWA